LSRVPAVPKIYHITHVDNLPRIIADGCLVSDATIAVRGGPAVIIGMSEIKRRRIEELAVKCHPDTKVGDYVPFFFCPRSIMLYVLFRDNNPELTYHGGQGPIVHLEADLNEVIGWADENGRRWAFSLSNAGAFYAQFHCRREELGLLDWKAIAATDFSRRDVSHAKQAEFLLHDSFPGELVRRVGVASEAVRVRVAEAVRGASHRPLVEVRPDWYYGVY